MPPISACQFEREVGSAVKRRSLSLPGSTFAWVSCASCAIGSIQSREFVVKVGRRLGSEVKILEDQALVRGVRIFVGLAEAHQEAWFTRQIGDRPDERYRPS